MRVRKTPRHRGDEGVAIVAAVGVALIGVVLAMLVVSQTIIVTQDTGRDRVRTSEVHNAEGVLDAALYDLTRYLPCEWPVTEVGDGATATEVALEISYFDEDNVPLTDCSGGLVEGDARYAVLTARAEALVPQAGIDPVRTIEATVEVTPRQGLSTGTTLFAASAMQVTNNGEIFSADPDDPAGIWIDNGNFQCNSNFTVNGDVVVAAGGAYLTNSCAVTGDLWARDYLTDDSGSPAKTRVAGNVTVKNGNMAVHNGSKYGGSLTVFGTISGNGFKNTDVGGTICAASISSGDLNGRTYTPCTTIPNMEPRGFPEITYEPADWVAEGFTIKSKDGASSWSGDVIAGWGLNASQTTQYQNDGVCRFWGGLKNAPITLTATPSVYDLRSCDFSTNSGVEFRIKADTAIFAKSFNFSNKVEFVSDDGQPHNVWLIVPFGGSGNLQTSNQYTMNAPLAAFYYSPNQVYISNQSTNRGQIYGKSLQIANKFSMEHVPIGVPGVDLGSDGLDVTSSGFVVDVLSKRERQQG